MLRSVVVMPAAYRPEFCALALHFLSKTDNPPPVFVYLDSTPPEKTKDEYRKIFAQDLGRTEGRLQINLVEQPAHREATSGCWNILQSIVAGGQMGAEFVFLVEEDIFVRPSFFTDHLLTMTLYPYDISCGRICPRFARVHPGVYTNPGSCLRGSFVRAILTPHVNDQFFENTGAYIRGIDPNRTGFIGGLDDGLIRRLVTVHGLSVHHQHPPLCSHVGIQAIENKYDFCRINEEAPIEERIRNLAELFMRLNVNDPQHGRYIQDLDPLSYVQRADLELFLR